MNYNAGTVGLAQRIRQRISKALQFRKTKNVKLVSVCTCCHNEY
jgi:hypothetical protein